MRKWENQKNPDEEMGESEKPRRGFPVNVRKTGFFPQFEVVYFKNNPK